MNLDHIRQALAGKRIKTPWSSCISRNSYDIIVRESANIYQQILEVVYPEAPNSMAYSTNKFTITVYPICVEYMGGSSDLQQAVIVFITDD